MREVRESYNKSIKEQFINLHPEESRDSYKYALLKSAELAEFQLDKDLYNFNDEELDTLLGGLGASSYQSILSYASYFKKYIDWAINKDMVYTNINLLRQPKFSGEELKKYIAKGYLENKYITKDDFDMILDVFCLNDQDRALYILPWNGALGSMSSELCNLKETDIDSKNKLLHLKDDENNKRTIEVDARTIDILLGACSETTYEVYGEATNGRSNDRKLVDTEYVIKKTATMHDTNKMTYAGISRRLNTIATAVRNEYLTPSNIWWSGLFYFTQKLKDERGKLTDEDYDKIIDRFGTSKKERYRFTLIKKIEDNIL